MDEAVDVKYASYLSSFRSYYEQNDSNDAIMGYSAKEGLSSLVSMKADFYELALKVFSHVDNDTKLGKRFFASRYPSILCAAFLVGNCPRVNIDDFKASNIAIMAEYLYTFDKKLFEINLTLLANDRLLSTIASEFPQHMGFSYACSKVIKNAVSNGVDISSDKALDEFWLSEEENIKNNKEEYTFDSEAKRGLLRHVADLSREGEQEDEVRRF